MFANEITKARICFSSRGSDKWWGLCLLCCLPHPEWLVHMSQMAISRAEAGAEQEFRCSRGREGSGQKGFKMAAPKHYVCPQTQPWGAGGGAGQGSSVVGFVRRFLFSVALGISLQLNIGLNSNFVADQ